MAKLSYKMSYYALYVCFAVILVVLGMFFLVGYNNPVGDMNAPEHTETLIYLMYALFGVTVGLTVIAAIAQFGAALKDNPMGAIKSLLGLVLLVAVVLISYAMGSDATITANEAPYTDTFWLKITDMFIYSIYFLLGIAALATLVNNSSSTADIAFMLLIFFLITTSMDTDRGLARRLPPPPENKDQKQDDIIVKERNVLQVRLNKDDQLMCGQDYIDIKQLKEKAKEFIVNPYDDEKLPEKHRKNIPLLGDCMITEKHVISVQNDVGTSYKAYIDVQNELVAAYNELRDELGKAKFGKTYAQCDEDEQKAIREYYPQKISEAEPKKYGGK